MKINFITRQLIRSASKGYLSTEFNPKNFKNVETMMSKPFSYSTFTMTAFDYDISPILLLSNLSEHTQNIINNNSVSLMLCEETKIYQFFPQFKNKSLIYEDPMSRPRVTLIGKLTKNNKDSLRRRFLSRHPTSNFYANFSDMNFYRLEIKSAHLVGGFAQVKWFQKNDLLCQNISNFEDSEKEVISHMNDHHKNSIDLYIKKLLKEQLTEKEKEPGWSIVGIDPDGFDLRKKESLTRIFFEKEITDAIKLRGIFVNLHKK